MKYVNLREIWRPGNNITWNALERVQKRETIEVYSNYCSCKYFGCHVNTRRHLRQRFYLANFIIWMTVDWHIAGLSGRGIILLILVNTLGEDLLCLQLKLLLKNMLSRGLNKLQTCVPKDSNLICFKYADNVSCIDAYVCEPIPKNHCINSILANPT